MNSRHLRYVTTLPCEIQNMKLIKTYTKYQFPYVVPRIMKFQGSKLGISIPAWKKGTDRDQLFKVKWRFAI